MPSEPAAARRSAKDGLLRLGPLPLGKVRVTIQADGHDMAERDVQVAAEAPSEIEVRLPRRKPLAEILERARVSCEFKETRPDDIVAFLGRVGGVNIIILPNAAERTQAAAVTLSIKDDTLANTLRAVCEAIGGVTYAIQDDVVAIKAVTK